MTKDQFQSDYLDGKGIWVCIGTYIDILNKKWMGIRIFDMAISKTNMFSYKNLLLTE